MDSSMLLMLGGVGALVYVIGGDAGWWPKFQLPGGGGTTPPPPYEITRIIAYCDSYWGRDPEGVYCPVSAGYVCVPNVQIGHRGIAVDLWLEVAIVPHGAALDFNFAFFKQLTMPAHEVDTTLWVEGIEALAWPDRYDGYAYWGKTFDAYVYLYDAAHLDAPLISHKYFNFFQVMSG